ncbi:GXWXG domain-containing protein [Streptomyces cinnamoneus]|uniref:GXWXG domain-containing protein n=1 Tax=Streptomyces cinnamoneus TaxID=53446 RepID=UPI0034243922
MSEGQRFLGFPFVGKRGKPTLSCGDAISLSRTPDQSEARPRPHCPPSTHNHRAGKPGHKSLYALWTQVSTVRPHQISGFSPNTGHPAADRLRALRWYGKAFHSPDKVEPMICRGESGDLNADRGRRPTAPVSALPRRDHHRAKPVVDYFKRADDDT